MEEKEIEVCGKKISVVTDLSKEYIEDNSLKILLDDTMDLGEVVSDVVSYDEKEVTNEMVVNEQK